MKLLNLAVNNGSARNGVTKKTQKGEFGEIELATPQDRNGEFEPLLVKKNQTRFSGFAEEPQSLDIRRMPPAQFFTAGSFTQI